MTVDPGPRRFTVDDHWVLNDGVAWIRCQSPDIADTVAKAFNAVANWESDGPWYDIRTGQIFCKEVA